MRFILIIVLALFAACSAKSGKEKTQKQSSRPEEMMTSATVFYDSARFDTALILLEKVLEEDSGMTEALILKADINMALNNFEPAMKAYLRALKQNEEQPELWSRLGKIYLNQGDFGTAMRYFKQAIQIDPTYADAYVGRAMVFAFQAKKEKALLSMQTALDFNPESYQAQAKMGEWQLQDSNELAIDYLNNAIRIDSSQPLAYILRAKAYQKFGMPEKSRADYEKVLTIDNDNTDALFNLGYLEFSKKNWNESVMLYQKVLAEEPQDIDAMYAIAMSYLNMSQSDSARQYFRRMLQINPNDSDALAELDKLK